VNQYELEVWQRPAHNQYFQPSPTTYYETTRRENRGQGGVVARLFAAVSANGILGWAAWSAHQACLNGNAHSAVAETVAGAATAATGALGGAGFLSRTEAGSWAGALLSPVALILAGFDVLLWAPKWPASMAAALLFGGLNGGIALVVAKLKREERKLGHEAGMQHDAITGRLQENWDTQTAKTERARIKHQTWIAVGHDADRRADRAVYDLHVRHPDIVAPPERYADRQPVREMPAGRQPRAITSGAEPPVDDWMDLAAALDEHVENR
jgi:hypothetical protein